MKNKYIKPYNIWFIGIFFLFFIRFLNKNIFDKVGNIATVVFFFSAIVIWSLNKNNILKKSINEIILFFFVILLSLIGSYTNSFSFGGFITILTYLGVLVGIKNLQLEDKLLKQILLYMSIFFFVFLTNKHSGYNPNTIGQVIYICTMYVVMYISTKKHYIIVTLCVLMIAYNGILLSKSRGVLLAFVLFIVLAFLIPKKIFYNRKFYVLLTLGLTIGSVIFCAVYVGMWQDGITFEVMNSSKNLYSGRQNIWLELFLLIKENLIFGVGSGYKLSSFSMFNAHNSMINLLAVYGAPTFFFAIYLINLRVIESYKNLKEFRQHKIVISAFYSFLFLAFFETNLLWEPVAFQGIFLLILANSLERREV